jgi:hypothetical protein
MKNRRTDASLKQSLLAGMATIMAVRPTLSLLTGTVAGTPAIRGGVRMGQRPMDQVAYLDSRIR